MQWICQTPNCESKDTMWYKEPSPHATIGRHFCVKHVPHDRRPEGYALQRSDNGMWFVLENNQQTGGTELAPCQCVHCYVKCQHGGCGHMFFYVKERDFPFLCMDHAALESV